MLQLFFYIILNTDKNLLRRSLNKARALSLRLVRNPSGFSERFPASGNDINAALLIAILVLVNDTVNKPVLKGSVTVFTQL